MQYNFDITEGTCNPDGGGSRECMLVNGQYPGPTVSASKESLKLVVLEVQDPLLIRRQTGEILYLSP